MPHHILIVDDAQDLARMFAQLLDDAGYTTAIAGTGQDALAQVQAQPPDLMLLDVNLPGLDGYALASMLKADPATATIPIVMVSAQDGRGARVIGLESGAEDYLPKPVDPVELLAKVRNLLALRVPGYSRACTHYPPDVPRSTDDGHRPAQRHRDPSHRRDARRHARRTGRRRRLRRGPHGDRAATAAGR